MLPAAQRLRRSSEFGLVVRRGRRAGRPLLVVHVFAPHSGSAEAAPARVGFVVSRAVGGSVVRNRVKRRLRHLLVDRLDRLPAGTSLVVRAQAAASTASTAQLAADLDAALVRVLA
jgi:ribonuclease P protein component